MKYLVVYNDGIIIDCSVIAQQIKRSDKATVLRLGHDRTKPRNN